ncbi:MAG: GyrI-like domain-containing protein [Acidobacteriaceae bacterium]
MISAARKFVVLPALALMAVGLLQQATAQAAPAATPAPAAAPAPAPAASPVKVENQESFIVVGATVRTSNTAEASGQGQIPGLWQNVMMGGQLDAIPNKVGDGMVVVYSDYAANGDYNYTLGVRVSSADKIPDGMVKRVIPAGKYAVVQSSEGAPQEVIPAMWKRIADMKPEEMGGARAYQVDFETYGAISDFSDMQSTAHIGLK